MGLSFAGQKKLKKANPSTDDDPVDQHVAVINGLVEREKKEGNDINGDRKG